MSDLSQKLSISWVQHRRPNSSNQSNSKSCPLKEEQFLGRNTLYFILLSLRFSSSYTASSSTSQLQLHPNVLRRFPLAVRIGTSPISKLEELFYNPFIREQRLRKKMERKIKPASRWKQLKVKDKQSPCHLSSVISAERAYETTLMRSPKRVVGLKRRIKTKSTNERIWIEASYHAIILPKPFIRSIYLPLVGFRDMVDPYTRPIISPSQILLLTQNGDTTKGGDRSRVRLSLIGIPMPSYQPHS
ncbi:hypothetical protein NE237_015137 [Protea cynaroides]|uniref:Uncharacterized protein n=1 Tax=Protea cynaroides TaxID=273540 RepID=A0A9Q0KDN4_9MAGN|nr:hypothetical protein NE237_015137 [Protea cynaroides]